jgi:hypothetical protein
LAQVALAWLVVRPGVTPVILGARTTKQLRDDPGRRRPRPDRGGDRAARCSGRSGARPTTPTVTSVRSSAPRTARPH